MKSFLYSQDLSNCTTKSVLLLYLFLFLYSQDLSNCTTLPRFLCFSTQFLYSQDLSNCTTWKVPANVEDLVFVLSRFK